MSYYSKADKARIDKFRKIGCIIAHEFYDSWAEYDVHHIVDGGRLGNQFTIPLHPWYHRGVTVNKHNQKEMERLYGPSLAKDKAAFEERFGTELQLLARVNELIGEK